MSHLCGRASAARWSFCDRSRSSRTSQSSDRNALWHWPTTLRAIPCRPDRPRRHSCVVSRRGVSTPSNFYRSDHRRLTLPEFHSLTHSRPFESEQTRAPSGPTITPWGADFLPSEIRWSSPVAGSSRPAMPRFDLRTKPHRLAPPPRRADSRLLVTQSTWISERAQTPKSVQSLEQICSDLPAGPRAAGHHDNASPVKLVAFLATLDPVEERGLFHVHGQLNIHWRLDQFVIAIRGFRKRRNPRTGRSVPAARAIGISATW